MIGIIPGREYVDKSTHERVQVVNVENIYVEVVDGDGDNALLPKSYFVQYFEEVTK